jgi:hypothetical protein
MVHGTLATPTLIMLFVEILNLKKKLKKNILSKKLRKLLKYFGIYLGVKLHEG